MHKVAHDREFLTATLAKTIKVDDFTARLFKIFETVWDEGLAQVRSNLYFTYIAASSIRRGLWLARDRQMALLFNDRRTYPLCT